MKLRQSLVIVQPYLPAYRVEFFSRLIAVLDTDGIDCVVAASMPSGSQANRGDDADAAWVVRVKVRAVVIAGRRLSLGGSRVVWAKADGVIIGLLGSSLDTYIAVFDSIMKKRRVGLWGHVKTYVSELNALDAALEAWQMRHVDQVFAYTEGGTRYALDRGIPASRVTTVMNAVDTESLAQAVGRVGVDEREVFGKRFKLEEGKVLAFIGGFDTSKRIDFLAAALDELWLLRPDVRVLVAGNGMQRDLFLVSEQRGQVVLLGYVNDAEKALIGTWASALLMPGRIGLVAVDALILGMPIVTTDWKFHAPEAEYLVQGISRFDAPDSPGPFAHFVVEFLMRPKKHVQSVIYPTLDEMVENYRQGVLRLFFR